MLNDNDNYYCRVCGLRSDDPVWITDTHGSFDICSCCGCEFGYNDVSISAIRAYREDWLKEGAK